MMKYNIQMRTNNTNAIIGSNMVIPSSNSAVTKKNAAKNAQANPPVLPTSNNWTFALLVQNLETNDLNRQLAYMVLVS